MMTLEGDVMNAGVVNLSTYLKGGACQATDKSSCLEILPDLPYVPLRVVVILYPL